jgi:hypothetical protein
LQVDIPVLEQLKFEASNWNQSSSPIASMPFSNGEAHLFQFNENGFDFNVQFEQLFFSVLPSVLFIITSAWRTFHQSRKPAVVHAPTFQLMKAVRYIQDSSLIETC